MPLITQRPSWLLNGTNTCSLGRLKLGNGHDERQVGGPRLRLHHALSGTSGFTSVTAFSRSSTTLSPFSPPIFFISCSFSSVSLSASSSAFLFPLDCFRIMSVPARRARLCNVESASLTYFLLVCLIFFLFLLAVLLYLRLGFVLRFFYSFGAIYRSIRYHTGFTDEHMYIL